MGDRMPFGFVTSFTIRCQSRRAKWIVGVTVVLAGLNFVPLWIVNYMNGGASAVNGYIRNAHYFVCSHGTCSEVSKQMWERSYWFAYSAVGGLLFVVVMLAIFSAKGEVIFDSTKSS